MSEVSSRMKDVMDNWNAFLGELEKNGTYFDKKLRAFLLAIEAVSEINVNKIADTRERNEIDQKLDIIVKFIKKYENEYYEIGLIKGFRTNQKNDSGQWPIDGRDYYYYIADQKMKASVYYVRYLNFINQFFSGNVNEEWQKERQLELDIEKLNNEVIDGIEEEGLDKKLRLRNERIISIECLRAKDINYLKYMLFNNTMREIKFVGASYQFLWHWIENKKTVYRGGSIEYDENSVYEKLYYKKDVFRCMFQDCVSHMNSSRDGLHSYSENLLLDIYKYLILLKEEDKKLKEETENRFESDDHGIVVKINENKNSVQFEFIKNASVNCIFGYGEEMSFQEFAVDENIKDFKKFSYSVEIFPQTLEGEKNGKGTIKYLRDVYFPEYFRTVTLGASGNLCKTKIADDKEVITYGKCYKKSINIDTEVDVSNSVETYEDGTRFYTMLNKEEILCLILTIGMKRKNLKQIVDEFVRLINLKLKGESKNGFKDSYSKLEKCRMDYDMNIKNWEESEGKKIGDVYNVIEPSCYEKLKTEEGKRFSDEKAEEKIKEETIKQLTPWFYDRYERIKEEYKQKIGFILSSLNEEDYNFDLVKQYTEYRKNEEDSEIAFLKQIVFKD